MPKHSLVLGSWVGIFRWIVLQRGVGGSGFHENAPEVVEGFDVCPPATRRGYLRGQGVRARAGAYGI
jgi:hypothetical protein